MSRSIPFADTSLYRVPRNVPDEAAVLLSDIFPTGFEIGVQYGRVKPGDTVAVVGSGPVGLAVMATAALFGAAQVVAIDLDENRLAFRQTGRRLARCQLRGGGLEGAGVRADPRLRRRRGGGSGRLPATFDMCTQLVRPGGNVANVAVHGTAAMLDLQRLWIQNINISIGPVNIPRSGCCSSSSPSRNSRSRSW